VIPRILHYCWVGPRPLSELGQRCKASWEKHLPGFEFRFWNEQNSPMEHPFMRLMYESGRYGFVPDYLRFWALEKYGGIYLDCDVELLGSLDPYLQENMLMSFASTQNRIRKNPPATALIGARPGHPFLGEILAAYDRLRTPRMSNSVVWDLLLKKGLRRRGERTTHFESILVGDIRIYHADRFHPVEQGEGGALQAIRKPGSVAIHYGVAEWGGPMEERTWWRKFLDGRPDRKLLRPLEAWLRRWCRKGTA